MGRGDGQVADERTGDGRLPMFLLTRQASVFLGLSHRTLEKHRVSRTGPIYRKLGGRVVYAVADLIAWADRGVRQSTSDRPADPIEPAGGRKVSCG
jgi:hypothetical protein